MPYVSRINILSNTVENDSIDYSPSAEVIMREVSLEYVIDIEILDHNRMKLVYPEGYEFLWGTDQLLLKTFVRVV